MMDVVFLSEYPKDSPILLLLAILLPLLAAIFCLIFRKAPNLRESSIILVALALFIVNCLLLYQDFNPKNFNDFKQADVVSLFEGFVISFAVNKLGFLFALIASFLWIVTTIYSIGYMRANKEKNQTSFYFFFCLSIFATMAIAYAANLFTMFIFYEFLTFATYPLVTHAGTAEAKKGGRTYLAILVGASLVFFLPAIIITYDIAGTTDFTIGGVFQDGLAPPMVGLLAALFLFGIAKTGVMPFNRWLPAAMVAPTPVSGLLHAVAVVKAGLFCFTKVFFFILSPGLLYNASYGEFWAGGFVAWVGTFTIIVASIIALRQDNLKKRLAYSTISQLSYTIMGVGLYSKIGGIAALLHIGSHAVAKITLFFAAGAIYTVTKKKNISQLGGIAKQMPITMLCFTIGAFSMIGLPPTIGFITKYYFMDAVADKAWYMLFEMMASTLLNAFYFLPIIFMAYFGGEKPHQHELGKSATKKIGQGEENADMIKNEKLNLRKFQGLNINIPNINEAPKPILIAICITASLTLALFFFAKPSLFWLVEHIIAEVEFKK